ncbi:MAG: gliding motility-associated C-terminal domain-containing protein [Bacteroidota bacterium]
MRLILLFVLPIVFISWIKQPDSSVGSRDYKTVTGKVQGPDTLIVDDLVFSDFFSPNGDGHNDTYIILNVENYGNNSLKVFNRWGEVVYLSSPYLNDWDGTCNQGSRIGGKNLSDGVYFFEFYNGNDKKAHGKITLKR